MFAQCFRELRCCNYIPKCLCVCVFFPGKFGRKQASQVSSKRSKRHGLARDETERCSPGSTERKFRYFLQFFTLFKTLCVWTDSRT